MSDEINVGEGNYLVYITSDKDGKVDLNDVRTFKGTDIAKSFNLKSSEMIGYLQSKGMGNIGSVIDNTTNFLGGNKKAGKKTSKKGGRRRGKTRKSK